ncbi:MAG: InlB B-repeat-containing protein [Lachnospiraceae bacterium]|nr:InlB B-repeat-containing protein [Lachnospiraceae bacterium]
MHMRKFKALLSYILVICMLLTNIQSASAFSGANPKTETVKKSAVIYVGQTKSIAEAGVTDGATWESANVKKVKVDKKGKITGVKKGKTTVTATTKDKKIVYSVNVKKPSLTAKRANLIVGESATVTINGARIRSVKVKDKTIAVATRQGVITAKKAGTTTLTYTDTNGKKYTCTVKVKVGLSKSVVYVTKGKSTTAALKGADVKKLTSTKEKVAIAKMKGKQTFIVKGIAKGTAKIKVKASNKKTYTLKAIVETPSISEAQTVLAIDDTKTLTVNGTNQAITWKSSKISVATVDENGVVTPVAAGETEITATDECGATYTCKLTVEEPRFESGEVTLTVGQNTTITLKSNTQAVTWTSSDEKIAKVDSKGTVTAVAVGEAQITASVASGASYVVKVKVTAAATPAEPTTEATTAATTATTTEEAAPPKEPETKTVDVVINTGDASGSTTPVKVGTRVGDIPVPTFDDNVTFVGWYADEARTIRVSDDELVSGKMTLYAKTIEIGDQKPTDVSATTAVSDADPSFTVRVKSSDTSLTAAQVLDQLEVTNVGHKGTDIDKKEYTVAVTGSNGSYEIKGKHVLLGDTTNLLDNYEKGGSYIIKLPEVPEEGKPVLTFDGYPDATREYDVNIKAVEQNNLALNDDVVVIAISELNALYDETDGTKKAVDYIDGDLTTVDGQGNVKQNDEIKGSFELSSEKAKKLHIGSVVSLYSGMTPEEALKSGTEYNKNENNHVIYVEITGVNGDVFSFKSAEASDVMKMPEILPVAAGKVTYFDEDGNVTTEKTKKFKYGVDLGLDDSDETLELPLSELDWSDDKFAQFKLDSETTLDEGDFIAFYTGTFGADGQELVGYEKVTEVVKTGLCDNPNGTGDKIEYMTIKTEEATLEDISDSGRTHQVEDYDLYDDLSQEELDNLKASVEEQFKNSHYIEQTSVFLAKAAMATDSFKDLTGLENFKDYTITLIDEQGKKYDEAELMALGSSSLYEKYKGDIDSYDQSTSSDKNHPKWEVDVTIAKAEYDVGRGKHVGGGFGIMGGFTFTITVHMPTGDMKIEVHMDITQECDFEIGFDGEIEWKTIAFIPIPVDLILEPSFQVKSYTGFDITTSMVGSGEDNELYGDIGEEIKRLCEDFGGEDPDKAESVSEFVTGKYQRLLEQNSILVNILKLRVKKLSFSVVPGLVKLHIDIFLVIYGDMDIFGLHFHYLTGKKTVIYIHLIKWGVDTQSTDIIPAEMDFYVYQMGTLSLRAGVAVEVTLGLTITLPFPPLSKSVDINFAKAGFGLEVGAYMDMSGLYYYHKNVKNGKTKEKFRGAQWSDIGIYVNMYLVASSVATSTWKQLLFDKEFPIKQIGTEDYPINFNTKQKDIKPISMRQYVKKFAIPDSYFMVKYLKLNNGKIGAKLYDTEKDYKVELSNSDWAYDAKERMIYLKDGFKGMESQCDATFIFTKNYYPLSDTPITRTFHITWDNYLDGYAITPYSQGGSYVEASVGKYGVAVTKPADPTRMGYVFKGWYTDKACTTPYTYPTTMPAESVEIYAGWDPATNTPYTIEYYLEDTEAGTYVYNSSEEFTGTTDTNIVLPTGLATKFEGYDLVPSATEVKITADGSAVKRVFYDKKRATITFKKDAGLGAEDTIVKDVVIGEPIMGPEFAKSGYKFNGWTKTAGVGDNVSAADLLSERVVGGKTLYPGQVGYATADATYTASWAQRDDINYRIEYYVQQPSGAYTVQAVTYAQGTPGQEIKLADIKNALVTAVFTDDQGNETQKSGPADTILTAKDDKDNVVVKYKNMTDGGQVCVGDKTTVKADGTTVVKINYEREKYTVNIQSSGQEGDSNKSFEVFYGGKIALPIPEKEGYTFKGYKDENEVDVPVADTGFSVITVKGARTFKSQGFTANTYTVAYDAAGGILAAPAAATEQFTYGTDKALQAAPTKAGFTFDGWKDANGVIYTAGQSVRNLTKLAGVTVTLTAQWKVAGYTITYDKQGGTIAEGANPTEYNADTMTRLLDYPKKAGYVFDGWYDGDNKVTEIPGGNAKNLNLVAHWTARTDTPYTVNHYLEDAEGEGKTLIECEKLTGTTGESVPAVVKNYTGFNKPDAENVTIAADGSAKVDYVYTRKSFGLTVVGGTTTQVVYGAKIPVPTEDGKVFAGWQKDGQAFTLTTMPAENITLTPVWAEADEEVCVVEHKVQGTDGNYETVDTEIVKGATGETKTVNPKNYGTGITAPEAITVTLGTDATAELKYDRIKKSVTWNIGDGAKAVGNYTDGKVYYGAPIIAPVLEKTGYTYAWDKAIDTTMGAEDLSYTATWTKEVYSVAFDLCGGVLETVPVKTVSYGEAYGELPTPTKTNTEFLGWYDQREGGNKIEATTNVEATADHILYARWDAVSGNIIYKGVAASEVKDLPKTFTYGERTTVGEPVKAGYTFLGWKVGTEETLYDSYVIDENVREAVTLTANWEAKEYTLSLYGYSGLYLIRNYKVDSALLNIPMPKNSGYRLTGWKDIETGEVSEKLPDIMPAKNLTLVAQWEEAVFKLVYKNLDDEALAAMSKITYKVGDNSFIIPAPTKANFGYEFVGWYTDPNFSDSSKIESFNPVAYDVTVYAKWTPKKYTVIFNGNGGKKGTDESYKEVYTYATLGGTLTNSFEKTGYTFKGWAFDQKATTPDIAADKLTLTADTHKALLEKADDDIVNVHAIWEATKYTITYNDVTLTDSSCSVPSAQTTATGHPNALEYTIESDDLTLASPTKIGDGYEFLGWYDGTTKVDVLELKGQTGNKTLTAKWAHAGIFSIKLVSSTSVSPVPDSNGKVDNNTSTFRITRTIPNSDKVAVSTDPQRVYYRTVNGTAIGGTATGINFYHVGGQNVFAVFSDKECYAMIDNEKQAGTISGTTAYVEFKVKQENIKTRYYGAETPRETNGTFAQLFTIKDGANGNKKYYTAELYRIASALGNVEGLYDEGKREAKREMTVPSDYRITKAEMYTPPAKQVAYSGSFDNGSEYKNGYGNEPFCNLSFDKAHYLEQGGASAKLNIKTYINRVSEDWSTWSNEYGLKYKVGNTWISNTDIDLEEDDDGVWRDIGTKKITWSDVATNKWLIYGDTGDKGAGGTEFWFNNHEFNMTMTDSTGPKQVGIAPAATTDYKKGDVVKFSVIFNELITSKSDDISVTASALSQYMPIEANSIEYTGGVGTNVLTFTAKASQDFSNTTWSGSGTNEELMKITPVKGTVTDLNGSSNTYN